MRYGERRPPTVRHISPPVAIRDDTKARRAWLQEELQRQLDAGEEAKITGQGCYQAVSVKIKREAKTRTQLRGFCQCCGGRWAVTQGKVAHHGYQRPGGGWQTPSCMGARHLPLSESNDRLLKLIAYLKGQRESLLTHQAGLATVSHLTMPYTQVMRGWGSTKRGGSKVVTADNMAEEMRRLKKEENVQYVNYPFSADEYRDSAFNFESLREWEQKRVAREITGVDDMIAFLNERNQQYLDGKFVGSTTEEQVPV